MVSPELRDFPRARLQFAMSLSDPSSPNTHSKEECPRPKTMLSPLCFPLYAFVLSTNWRAPGKKISRLAQQFPACDFRPQNTLVLISHFANLLCIMLSRIPYLTTWANGVARHGTCSR